MTRITAPGSYAFTIPVEGGKPIQGVRVVGNSSGKTLVVTAGVHGDEYVGIQAVRELLSQLSPQELSGQVLFVPVVNTSGFFSGTYRVPEDGENLNRCFPGAKGHTPGTWLPLWKMPSIQRQTSFWIFTAAPSMKPWSLWRSFPLTQGAELNRWPVRPGCGCP
ncbi:MAG: succinylglutamate desuccinylase/aspartoacylase family protein [Neglectibacter timonensis]